MHRQCNLELVLVLMNGFLFSLGMMKNANILELLEIILSLKQHLRKNFLSESTRDSLARTRRRAHPKIQQLLIKCLRSRGGSGAGVVPFCWNFHSFCLKTTPSHNCLSALNEWKNVDSDLVVCKRPPLFCVYMFQWWAQTHTNAPCC